PLPPEVNTIFTETLAFLPFARRFLGWTLILIVPAFFAVTDVVTTFLPLRRTTPAPLTLTLTIAVPLAFFTTLTILAVGVGTTGDGLVGPVTGPSAFESATFRVNASVVVV